MGEKKPWTTERVIRAALGSALVLFVLSALFNNGKDQPAATAGDSASAKVAETGDVRPTSISEKTFLKETFGCKDWDTWKSLGKVVAQGDKEAFAKILYPALARDTCRRFKPGDRAYLSETAVLSGSTCMRPKGETACYWVSIETTGNP